MKKHLSSVFLGLLTILFFSGMQLQAQTTVSGKVTDTNGNGLPGVNIKVEGTVSGTISKPSGDFTLKVQTAPPFKLIFSFVGYESQTVEITGNQSGLSVSLAEETQLGKEVVISASRVEESVMESPVTVEKMDILAIQQASTADFYDQISSMKGVYTASGSLTFTSFNTRGFATIANTRFVQLIDGMDNSAPLLNFPAGNVIGISELDVESVELVPGAASALYGPNAFNGILMMNSKSPFDYQGLSAQVKVGVTNSNTSDMNVGDAHGTQPYFSGAVRYAKAFFDDRLAVKVNFSYLQAQDWRANDYTTYRTVKQTIDNPNNPVVGDPAFDGLNLYGDETNIAFARLPATSQSALVNGVAAQLAPSVAASNPMLDEATATAVLQGALPGIFNNVSVNRTGFREQDLLDNNDARSIKADAAIHYRINDQMELSYTYRYGSGSTIYQGGERYGLRDFSIQLQKLELKGNNFFVRAYMSQTDDGDSYNLSALGAFANERISPTSTQWLPNYLGNYAGALIQQTGGAILTGTTPTAEQIAAANGVARTAADVGRPERGSEAYNALIRQVREDLFKRNPSGAAFVDESRFYHAEFNYNFSELWDWMEVQVGGNFRRYDLFSDNTVFNENREGGTNQRITIDEYGMYMQLMKRFIDDRLKLTASIRYDKNQNFDGQVTPRISAVFSAGAERQHNFRTSFQTGFRNPDTQAQFILFPSSSGILLGGTQENAQQYGIYEGGALNTSGQPVNLDFVQPEQLSSIEVGYKGIIADDLFLDLNYYYNTYNNFISGLTVLNANPITNPNFAAGDIAAGTQLFRPYINSDVPINSQGIGVGVTYNLPVANLVLSGNYSYADFSADVPQDSEFEVQFNTPQNRFNIGLESRDIVENLGFALAYRWQEGFRWESAFGHGDIPAFGVFDAQINYKVPSIKTIFKIGGTNLFGDDYRSNFGGPFVGQLYYLSITFDEFMR